jgi:hypothetical protein
VVSGQIGRVKRGAMALPSPVKGGYSMNEIETGNRGTRRYSGRFSHYEGLPYVDVMNAVLASRVVDVRLTGNVLKGKATTARHKGNMTCIQWERIGMLFCV